MNSVLSVRRDKKAMGRLRNLARQSGKELSAVARELIDDGLVGQQMFAGETTRLAYMTDEAAEGRDAFLQKRDPNWAGYPWYF